MRSVTYLAFAAGTAMPAQALDVLECERITHVWHAGEADHADLGEGRVMWTDWWSQEGSAETINVMDCLSGALLSARTQEENMTRRAPFDRTGDAMKIIARHESGARVFAKPERMADDLDDVARDATVVMETQETCACAALYPEQRGDKTEFRLESQ